MYQPIMWPRNYYYSCCPCFGSQPHFYAAYPWDRNEVLPGSQEVCVPAEVVKLNQLFRTLWEQHVAWTRMLIISIAEGLADEAVVTERLLRNPTDMAQIFEHYYGKPVGDEFNRLFTQHLVLAAELVKEAKAGQTEAAAEAERKWYANADEIAAFLSSINPNWNEEDLKGMLHEHLKLTKEEAVLRLQKQYKQDIAKFDEIEQQALTMADAFASGISIQFYHTSL